MEVDEFGWCVFSPCSHRKKPGNVTQKTDGNSKHQEDSKYTDLMILRESCCFLGSSLQFVSLRVGSLAEGTNGEN